MKNKQQNRKFLYIMKNSAYPFRCKIGISDNPKRRRDFIQNSMKGNVTLIWFEAVPFALFYEQTILFLFAKLRTRTEGSGQTEWLWLPPVVVFLAVLLLRILVAVIPCAIALFFVAMAVL
jgi:hypothetical protein